MKILKPSILVFVLILPFIALSQVGIGTVTPNAQLEIRATNQSAPSNTDGILIPKVDEFPSTNPTALQDGMMVYITGAGSATKGFYYWDNNVTNWIVFSGIKDHDFYKIGTSNPSTSINDEIYTQGRMAIGQNSISNTNTVLQTSKSGTSFLQMTSTDGSPVGLNYDSNGSGQNFAMFKTASAGTEIFSFTRANNAFNGWNLDLFLDENGNITMSAAGNINNKIGFGENMIGFSEENKVTIKGYGNTAATNALKIKKAMGEDMFTFQNDGKLKIGPSGFDYLFPAIRGNNSQLLQADTNGRLSWVDASSLGTDEADWFEESTTIKPNNINDDIYTMGNVAIGKNIANFPLDIESTTSTKGLKLNIGGTTTGSIIASSITNSNTGSGSHYGIFNSLNGTGTGGQFGIKNFITNSSDGAHYGTYNEITGTGNGVKNGVFNSISGANTNGAELRGVHNNIFGASLGTQIGVKNVLESIGPGLHIGIWNLLSNTGTGQQIGIQNNFSNSGDADHIGIESVLEGSGSGVHYGSRIALSGLGSGNKYGVKVNVDSGAGGTHYGFFSAALKSGSFSGVFLGDFAVGTTLANKYILPSSRGTANQVMQTDGSGNVTWATVSGADNLGNHSATTNLDMNNNNITEVNLISGRATSSYDKIRLYNNSNHTIGMHSAMTLGYLNDWAMTFTMNDDADRGWLWRDINDSQSDGAMSLNTNGDLYLKGSLRADNYTLVVDGVNDRVGIGTAIPNTALHIEGGVDASLATNSGYVVIGDLTGQNMVIDQNEIIARGNGANATLFLNHTGGDVWAGGALVHSSDRRLKRDITSLEYGLTELMRLEPKQYFWKNRADQKQKSLGLIAQDVQKIIKNIVHEGDDEQHTLSISYTELVPVLIKATQEQQSEIETLKLKLEAQQKEIDEFKKIVQQLINKK